MKYKIEDLDYIYIRGQKADGSWDNFTLNEIDDKQFLNWIKTKFKIEIKDDENAKGTPWTPIQKVDFLNEMSKRAGGQPIVCMIIRKARKNLDINK
jgi:hypothetical protein